MGKLNNFLANKENKRKYCFNCAKQGHLGHVSWYQNEHKLEILCIFLILLYWQVVGRFSGTEYC